MKHIDWQVKQEPLTSREMRKGIEMMSELLLTLMVRFFLHFQLAVDGMKRGEVLRKKKWGYLKRHTSKKDKKKETFFFHFIEELPLSNKNVRFN